MAKVSKDDVIVVNENDEWLGTMEKMKAHKDGILHRAFSVFVLNNNNELLIQQRATTKYHSAGLWSNTCCSHPIPDESTMAGAHRRLREEMGFDCPLKELFTLRYKAQVDKGLIENEYDHIYFGYYDEAIHINPDEVSAFKYIPIDELEQWMTNAPALFTPWLHLAFPKIKAYVSTQQVNA
jgi:isopentenyl-diphosphate delta-isomerase